MKTDHARATLCSLSLRDFRNLAHIDLTFPAAGVVVIGENGQGKSNLLEAIYYLHLLRSVRGARDVDVVRFGQPGFHIGARTEGGPHYELSVGFEPQGKRKRVKLDGSEPQRLSDALGALPCVLFSPADVELVAGAPNARRRYLDILLALSSRRYLHALQRYRHALAQRNAALRQVSRAPDRKAEQRIVVWEAPLAEYGAVLWLERVLWAAAAAPRFAVLCAAIGERAAATLRWLLWSCSPHMQHRNPFMARLQSRLLVSHLIPESPQVRKEGPLQLIVEPLIGWKPEHNRHAVIGRRRPT